MNLRSLALSLALVSVAASAVAADNNAFILTSRSGKPLGKASYTVDKVKEGYRVRAHFEYHLSAAMPDMPSGDPGSGAPMGGMITEAQYISDYKVDANGNYLSGYMQNATTQIITSFQPSKPRDNVTIGMMQGGVSGGSRTLPMPSPEFLIAPDYDPSVIQLLLTCSLAHPHADSKYTLLIPAGPNPKAGPKIIYIALQPLPDANGALDGKPVALKHYQIDFLNNHGDLYTDAAGNLMEAEMSNLSAVYTRAKFALAAQ